MRFLNRWKIYNGMKQTTDYGEDVSLDMLRAFLIRKGYRFRLVSGGHEQWTAREGMRPVVLSRLTDPVPPFIIMQALRAIGVPREDLEDYLSGY